MSAWLRNQVRQRAVQRCEYCRMPEDYDTLVFHWDHIIAQKPSAAEPQPEGTDRN